MYLVLVDVIFSISRRRYILFDTVHKHNQVFKLYVRV